MKILFVYPNVSRAKTAQLGLCMISAVAREAGHESALFDFTTIPEGSESQEFQNILRTFSPDLIALSCRSNEWTSVDRLFREVDTGRALKVFGGPHATVAPEQVLERADVAVRGEGERTFAELLERRAAGKPLTDVVGCWVKEGVTIHRNPMRELIANLDDLPFPCWDLFDKIHFQDSYLAERFPQYRVVGAFESSRGCPYACTYCTNAYVRSLYAEKGKWRRRKSPERLVEEMRRFRDRFGLDFIYLIDEVFLTDVAWLRRFRDCYKAEIGAPFNFMERPENIRKERLDLAREAGAVMVSIGIESGDETLREEVLNRKYPQEALVRAFQGARDAGLISHAFTMVGLPEETSASRENTFRMLRESRPDTAQTSVFFPLPGTPLFSKVVDERLFDPATPMPRSYYGETALKLDQSQREEIRRAAFLLARYRSVPGRFFFRMAQRSEIFFRIFFGYPHHAVAKFHQEGLVRLLLGIARHTVRAVPRLGGRSPEAPPRTPRSSSPH